MSAIVENKEVKETKTAEPVVIGGDDHKEQAFSLDDETGCEIIKLTSVDNVQFDVTKKEALISQLVATSLECDISAVEIPIPSVKGKILAYIVEYMKHHNGVSEAIIEKPLKSKIMKEVCSDQWDAGFIDRIGLVKEELYDLILGANYMNIKCLLHLGCAKVGTMIKGQPLDKIREILAIIGPVMSAASQSAVTPSVTSITPALAATSINDASPATPVTPVTIHSNVETS